MKIFIIGKKFNKLTVISQGETIVNKCGSINLVYNCKCDCGNEISVRGACIRTGHTKSCGCVRSEMGIKKLTKHGKSSTRAYKSWKRMRQRCFNKNNPDYSSYGGRGIKICQSWQEYFHNFYDDMGEMPIGFSLDRINVDGDYEPGNCRWIKRSNQMTNVRKTVWVKIRGRKICFSRACKVFGVEEKIAQNFYKRKGMTPIDAIRFLKFKKSTLDHLG